MAEDLHSQARRFAAETSELLNGTVADGVRVSALSTASGRTIMGVGIKKTQAIPDPIPIAPSGGKALVLPYLIHSYELDPEDVYLTMSTSTMSLYTSPEMEDDQLIVGIDYVRNPSNEFPGSHLHVAGHRCPLPRRRAEDTQATRPSSTRRRQAISANARRSDRVHGHRRDGRASPTVAQSARRTQESMGTHPGEGLNAALPGRGRRSSS